MNEFLAAQVVESGATLGTYYYVSTINRESGLFSGDVYSETLVFEWDKESQKRGGIVYQAGHCADSLWEHNRLVDTIREYGVDVLSG